MESLENAWAQQCPRCRKVHQMTDDTRGTFECGGTFGAARCEAALPRSRRAAYFFRWGSVVVGDGAELEVRAHATLTAIVARRADDHRRHERSAEGPRKRQGGR